VEPVSSSTASTGFTSSRSVNPATNAMVRSALGVMRKTLTSSAMTKT
jgi:hypothetical protein